MSDISFDTFKEIRKYKSVGQEIYNKIIGERRIKSINISLEQLNNRLKNVRYEFQKADIHYQILILEEELLTLI